MSNQKVYLGDGVYADTDTDGYGIVLTTENGVAVTNTIYLERAVYRALVAWVERLRAQASDKGRVVMSPLRERARCMRLHIAAGGTFTEEDPARDGVFPTCCGQRCTVSGGLFGGRATCTTCGAEICDLLAPLDSPILERGNAFVTVPGDKLIERLGERHWLVMHEGDRDAELP